LLTGGDGPLSLLKPRRRRVLGGAKFRFNFTNLRQRRAGTQRQREKNNDVSLTSS
jgi:hypothetical protein